MLLQQILNKQKFAYLDKLYDETSDFEILTYFLGFEPKINKAIHSPIRARDDNPSLLIYRPTRVQTREEALWFKDMATGDKGNTIHFVQLLLKHQFNLDLGMFETVKYIDSQLGLGIYGGEKVFRPRLDYTLPPKGYKDIFFKSRGFTKRDIAYWDMLGVNEELLKHYDIRSVKYILDKDGRVYKEFFAADLAFVYVLWDKVKIYRPEADRQNRFRNNCPGDDYQYYQGYKQLEHYKKENSKLIITKSMKDVVTFKGMGMRNNLLLDTIAPHAESNFMDKKFLDWACQVYTDVLVVGDFDLAGIKFVQDCRKKNNKVRYEFTDTKRLKINGKMKVLNKDISDYCNNMSLVEGEKLFMSWYP